MGSRKWLPWLAMVMVSLALSNADIDKDKQACTETLIGLSTCLPYVSSQSKAPTMDCCTGLKQVLQKNKVCLCILIKDRDDPSLGLKINATLALGLPETCHAPANISDCPRLMNLPPNSTDAKVFDDYAKTTKTSNNTTITTPGNESNGKVEPSGDIKSDVGRGNKWLGVEKVWSFLFIIVMVLFHIA